MLVVIFGVEIQTVAGEDQPLGAALVGTQGVQVALGVGAALGSGQDLFTVHVRIHHADYGVLICQDPDDHRELPESELLCRMLSAVAGDDLIHAFRKRTDDQRGQDPIPADAVDQVFHLLVILHLKWVAAEWSQALQLNLHDPLIVTDFVSNMANALSAANLVVSRAGAGSISEFALLGKAVILVPSPNVSEDHQTKNAMALVNKNAAIYVADAKVKDELITKAIETVNDDAKIAELEENTDQKYEKLYVVGGGAKNTFLNRLTEEATGKRVVALPIEATALGNLKIQMEADDELS